MIKIVLVFLFLYLLIGLYSYYTKELYPVENYGSSMGFWRILLWPIGGISIWS